MKKRRFWFGKTRARLERLEREVALLKERRDAHGEGIGALLIHAEGVPLSQLISEYLYGEEGALNE